MDGILGSGSFGTVRKEWYKGEIVAAKHINSDAYNFDTGFQTFIREVSALQTMIGSPYIIQMRGFDISERIIYMELAERSLGDAIYDRTVLNIPIILRQITYGLYHLNRAGIWHRDVKPGNILIMRDGTIRIGDLGLSRGGPFEAIDLSTVVYTRGYMAPEILLV